MMPKYLTLDDMEWDPKDPESVIDYGVDFSGLIPEDDTIVDATWTPPNGTVTISRKSYNGRVAFAFISGGVAGQIHEIDVEGHSAQNRTVNRTLRLPILQLKG